MVLKKLRAKGKEDERGIIVPDIPEHDNEWQINQYDEETNTFVVVMEILESEIPKVEDNLIETESEKELRKVKEKVEKLEKQRGKP